MDAPSNNQTRGIRRSLLGLGLAALLLASCAGGKGDSGAAGETGTPGTNFVPMTVSVANLAQGSTVETGFMVGTTTDGSSSTVATVEVSLDGHTYSAATGAASWKFQLPAGGKTWKHGTQHTLTVVAKDANGVASAPVFLTVQKGANKDVNGDGYADVVAGASGYSGDTGRAYVFHSAGGAGVTATAAASANTVITGEPATASQFGNSVALGDVNGDGYADVVAGALFASSFTGRVYVFHSTGTGGITATTAVTGTGGPNSTITGEAAVLSRFGISVALGDVNGDGYADVVAGAYVYSGGTGRVYVFHSAGSGGVAIATAALASRIITGEASSNFGFSVALGDVNGDGYADVVAGAPNYSGVTGRAYVFHSTGTGGITATTAVTGIGGPNSTITGEAAASSFGSSVALGDVNGDGYADVVAGAPNYSGARGRAYVFHSTGTGGITATTAVTGTGGPNSTITGEAVNNFFGTSVALGDVNGDGYADVVAGATGNNGFTGRAYVFHSAGSAGVTATASTVITGEAAAASSFGSSVALGDVNGDGYADLVAGADGYSSSAGRAYVFHSAGGAGVTTTAAASANTIITGEASSGFGISVAAATLPGGGAALLLAALRPTAARLRRRR